MANSYVFRKIDGDLWREARGECTKQGINFLELVQQMLRAWLDGKLTISN